MKSCQLFGKIKGALFLIRFEKSIPRSVWGLIPQKLLGFHVHCNMSYEAIDLDVNEKTWHLLDSVRIPNISASLPEENKVGKSSSLKTISMCRSRHGTRKNSTLAQVQKQPARLGMRYKEYFFSQHSQTSEDPKDLNAVKRWKNWIILIEINWVLLRWLALDRFWGRDPLEDVDELLPRPLPLEPDEDDLADILDRRGLGDEKNASFLAAFRFKVPFLLASLIFTGSYFSHCGYAQKKISCC